MASQCGQVLYGGTSLPMDAWKHSAVVAVDVVKVLELIAGQNLGPVNPPQKAGENHGLHLTEFTGMWLVDVV